MPCAQDRLPDQVHAGGRRLWCLELLDEKQFEFGLGGCLRGTPGGNGSSRTGRCRPSTSFPSDLACIPANKAAQRQVGSIPFARPDDANSCTQNSLNSVEHLFVYERIEIVPTADHTGTRRIDDADVEPVLEQRIERLSAHLQSAPCSNPVFSTPPGPSTYGTETGASSRRGTNAGPSGRVLPRLRGAAD